MENQVVEQNNAVSKQNCFDGKVLGFVGWCILSSIVTSITFGILCPLAVSWMCKWFASHTVIEGKRYEFTGDWLSLLGKYIIWLILCIITLGIYSFALPVKFWNWIVVNTKTV